MADITLHAELRTETGSRPAGRLRAAGKLPAIVYGKGHESVNLMLNHHDVSKALHDPASREGEMTLDDRSQALVQIRLVTRNTRGELRRQVGVVEAFFFIRP